MERGLNCVKVVTTLSDGTNPREEKHFEECYVAVLLYKQSFSCRRDWSSSKMPFLGISCSQD